MVFTTLEKKNPVQIIKNCCKKERKRNTIRSIPINHNILFPLPSYPKILKISIDLDEIKRKLARIYVVFNLKNYKTIQKIK